MRSGGPVPKRSDQGHRTTRARKENGDATRMPVTRGRNGNVTIPAPDPDWHPIARQLYDAMLESGARHFYESTDWAVLYTFCDDLSYYKSMGKRSGQMLAALNGVMTSLLLTEGDRRRVQIELDRHDEDELKSAGVAMMEEYRRSLAGEK